MKDFLKVIAIDALSLVLFLLLSISFLMLLFQFTGDVLIPDTVFELSEEEVIRLANTVQDTYLTIVVIVVIMFLLSILVTILSRAMIWAVIEKKKMTKKYLGRSLWAFLWYTIGMIPALLLALTFKKEITIVSLIVYFLLFSYLSTILFMNYSSSEKFLWKQTFKDSLRYGLFYVFMLTLGATFILAEALNSILPDSPFSTIFLLIVLLVFLARMRFFMQDVKKRG